MPEIGSKAAARRRRTAARQRSSRRVLALVVSLFAVLAALAIGGVVAVVAAARYVDDLPRLDSLESRQFGENSIVFDKNGTSLGVLATLRNRQAIPQSKMSKWLPLATIAIEDRRFYLHDGVDYRGIARAFVRNLQAGGVREGASTLTQQLISVLYRQEKTVSYTRKIREAWLARQLEEKWSKEKILSTYMNSVFYGENAYGVEAAAETYFGKHAQKLTLAESALIAGLPQAPTDYNPFQHPQLAKQRRNEVLQAMLDTNKITKRQFARASREKVELHRGTTLYGNVREPIFVDYVSTQLAADKRFNPRTVRSSGLRILTTIDPQMQRMAYQAISGVLKTPGDPAAAIVAIRPKTGEILAMASSAGLEKGQRFDLASQARRQPGSTFKMLTLATAIEQGIDPSKTNYLSAPFDYTDPYGEPWHVTTGHYLGVTTLERATVNSDNTVFAQLAIDVGPASIIDLARRIGIKSANLIPVPSITLGTMDVSPLEMTSAYATIASGGVYHAPTAIREVKSRAGKSLAKYTTARGARVLSDGVTSEVSRILEENMISGTGTTARLDDGRPQAGKTGTTENNWNAWFCGYTPDLATCVWMGYVKEQRPMQNVEGQSVVQGPNLPSTIWHDFMTVALASVPPTPWTAAKEPVVWLDPPFQSQFTARAFEAPEPPPSTVPSDDDSGGARDDGAGGPDDGGGDVGGIIPE